MRKPLSTEEMFITIVLIQVSDDFEYAHIAHLLWTEETSTLASVFIHLSWIQQRRSPKCDPGKFS